MRCLMFLCLALMSATTAFGQQQQQASVRVSGGTIVGQFIPDGGSPEPDGYVPIQQVQPQQGGVQQHQHSHQHAHNCTCQQCKRTVVGRTRQVYAKTHMTVVTTEHSVIEHPVQSFNESPAPCPTQQRVPCPRNPCVQPGIRTSNTGGLASSWDANFRGYQPQQHQQQRGGLFGGLGGRPLVSANVGGAVLGYGPQLNFSVGPNQPMQALPSWR
jgi:hypothetical protein